MTTPAVGTPRRLPPTFGLYDVHDMLAKLTRELARLRRSRKLVAIEDTVFNFAVTAWHMVDWVCADELALGTVAAGSSKGDYQAFARETCRELALLEFFANGQKHARPERRERSAQFAGSPSYITLGGPSFETPWSEDDDAEPSPTALPAWSDEPPAWALTVAAHDHREDQIVVYTLVQLCEGALAFWRAHLPERG